MKRNIFSFKSLIITSLILCGLPVINAQTKPTAETARIQIIHNSPDAVAQKVDMWVNGDKIEDFRFQTATEFFDVLAGSVKISIGSSESKSEAEAIKTFTYQLEKDKRYIIAAQGILSPIGYAPAAPFTVSIFDMARELANNPANTDILMLHGGTDSPELDVWAPGSVKPLADNLKFGQFANDYFQYPANDVYLGLREPSGEPTKTIASYGLSLQNLGLAGKSVTVVLSGFMNPQSNSNGAKFGLYAVTSLGGQFINLPQAIGGINDKNLATTGSNNSKMFPNPCKDFSTITISSHLQPIKLNVVNINGEVEYSENLVNNLSATSQVLSNGSEKIIRFETKNLSKGKFFIQLLTNQSVIINELIKID